MPDALASLPAAALALAPLAFLGSFVYGVTGFGSGLVTVPLASHLFPLPFVLAVFALVDAANALRTVARQPREVVRSEAVRLVPACVAGVGLGAALLLVLPAAALMAALGMFVLAYVGWTTFAPRPLPTVGPGWAPLAGLAGGVASAMFGAGGPPYVVYLSLRPHSPAQLRATLALTSLVSIGARIVAFAWAGLLSSAGVWLVALAVLPVTLLALHVADRVHARLSRDALLHAIRALLAVAGASLVLRALAGAPV
jgi:uncharacterized membrane protein YfcA